MFQNGKHSIRSPQEQVITNRKTKEMAFMKENMNKIPFSNWLGKFLLTLMSQLVAGVCLLPKDRCRQSMYTKHMKMDGDPSSAFYPSIIYLFESFFTIS